MRTKLFAYAATLTVPVVILMPVTLAAQSLAGSDPHPNVHLYDVADFGIDAADVTFTKHIAPSCSGVVRAATGLTAARQCPSSPTTR